MTHLSFPVLHQLWQAKGGNHCSSTKDGRPLQGLPERHGRTFRGWGVRGKKSSESQSGTDRNREDQWQLVWSSKEQRGAVLWPSRSSSEEGMWWRQHAAGETPAGAGGTPEDSTWLHIEVQAGRGSVSKPVWRGLKLCYYCRFFFFKWQKKLDWYSRLKNWYRIRIENIWGQP